MAVVKEMLVKYRSQECALPAWIPHHKVFQEAKFGEEKHYFASQSQVIQIINTKNGMVKDHLLQNISRVCTLFSKEGGHIHCRVTGGQGYFADLRQEGLE